MGGLAYYAGGTMGRAAGSAPRVMGQLAPQANFTLQQNGNWTVSEQPSAGDVMDEFSAWAAEPSVIPSISNGGLAAAAAVMLLLFANRGKK